MAEMNKKDNVLQAIKFALFSASAGIIQVGSFTILNELVLPNIHIENEAIMNVLSAEYGVCYLIALTLSVLWNFTFNRKFTFKSATNVPVAMLKVALFYVVYAPLSAWAMKVLTGEGFMWNEYLVQILTMTVNLVTEYLYQRFFVFGKSLDTQVKKQ